MGTYAKIRELLTPKERRSGLVLLVLMIVGMLFETLGVGLVIPAITLMMHTDIMAVHPEVYTVVGYFGPPTQALLIGLALLGLVVVYLVKNIFLAFLIWRQTKFAYDVQANLSQRLFTTYLRQPYTFHLQKNSAELVRNVSGEVGLYSVTLTSALMLMAEFLVVAGIGLLLLSVETLGALIVMVVLGASGLLLHRATRDRITRWGAERQYHDGLRLQHLQQGLGGAKDVKLLGREGDFLDQYRLHNTQSAKAWKLQITFMNLPRLIFEQLAVIGLAILVISMLKQGREMASIIPVVGLFAAAAFRLIPSVNRILTSIQALRFSIPVVDVLHKEMKLTSPEMSGSKCEGLTFNEGLKLKEVTYCYDASRAPTLKSITLTIRKGEFVGFIGSSGSGKSTLVDIIMGLLTPGGGVVEVDGQDITHCMRQWQDQIGYVPQSIYLTDDTLRRNVAFGLPDQQIDSAAVMRAIKAAQLEEFVATLPEGLDTIVGERGVRLSGGQRQRIGIARALYHDPAVLILDEATSALDGATERGVMEAVAALHGQKTVVVVAHRLTTVENCDRLFHLERGVIVNEGRPEMMLPLQNQAAT